MNPIKVAIIFTIITIPFYFIIFNKVDSERERLKYENNFINGINTALYDAKVSMNKSIKTSFDDVDNKQTYIDEKEVIDSFLKSYYLYFNARNEVDRALLRSNILALVLVDYDGFYIYGAGDKGDHLEHIISEKHPYKYEKDGTFYYFTLGNIVKKVDFDTNKVNYEKIGHLFTDTLEGDEELIKNKCINDSIIGELKNTLYYHKKLGQFIGSSFDYYLPLGENSSLARNIDSIGIISIIEGRGYPVAGKIVNVNYSEADIEMNCEVYCFEEDGTKYYSEKIEDVKPPYLIFYSKKEASSHGYLPYKNHLFSN